MSEHASDPATSHGGAAPVEVIEAPRPATERSPVDVLRLVIGGAVIVVLLILDLFFSNAVLGFLEDLLRGLDALPTWTHTAVVAITRLALVVLVVVGVGEAALKRRVRELLTVALAGVAALVIMALVDPTFEQIDDGLVEITDDLGPISAEGFPTAAGLAMVAAAVTAAAPWLARFWRRVAWATVVLAALSRFVTAPVSLDTPMALAIGWVVGSAVLVGLGGPLRRAPGDAVAAGLAGVGIDLAQLKQADVDARGSTPYFGATADGTKLFVKVLGADERNADTLFRLYRRISPRDLGDEKPFSSLRRTVEHEALVSLTARDNGIPTPRVVAFAVVEPDSFVLAYEAIAGRSLDRVDAEALTDELVAGLWEQVRELRSRRIAHRDLRLANLFLGDDGSVLLIDFGFSELAASDLLLATDVAELTASLSLKIGAERAVAHAAAAVGPDGLRPAVARLKPYALSGATRAGMKENPGLLDDVRARVEQATAAALSA